MKFLLHFHAGQKQNLRKQEECRWGGKKRQCRHQMFRQNDVVPTL